MAAAPCLVLLLLLPPPVWANEGGALGDCRCHKQMNVPGNSLLDLAAKVVRYQPCRGHLIRFQLPRMQICGLEDSDWVIRLSELLKRKEASWIDASQEGRGPAPNSPNAPQLPNTHAQMPRMARPTEPSGPIEPYGATARPTELHRPTARPTELHGPTARPTELHGPTARPTARPTELHRPTTRPMELHRPPLLRGPLAQATEGALPTDPIGGPSLAPQQGEGAGNGPRPVQFGLVPTAVLALLGITLALVGVVTYLLCQRNRGPHQVLGIPHRSPGNGLLYYPCELG